MSGIVSTIQEIVRHELRSVRVTELGLVEAVYPHSDADDGDNYGCDVRLKNSDLLLRRVTVATSHIGTAAIPNVGDLVLVAFGQGNVNQPIIIGRLYNDEDRPPVNRSDELIFRLPLAQADNKTIKGQIRNFQDDDPAREILVEMPPKITLQINDGKVHAIAGNTRMMLDQASSSGGKVTVRAGSTIITMNEDGDVTIDAAGSMTLKAASDLKLEAGGNISLTAQNIDMTAAQETTMEAGMQATITGGIGATLQGVNVSIKGLASFGP